MDPRERLRRVVLDAGELARETAVKYGVDKHLGPLLPDPVRMPKRTFDEVKADLDGLIGLNEVKEQVDTHLAFLEVQAERQRQGFDGIAVTHHLAFLGNPGTGKTTVARLLAELYGTMGLLEIGHLIEVDRSGLVGQYVGHTAARTSRAVRKAIGGVLFIDEAYALTPVGPRTGDFGAEAIETLVKRMEDHRHNLVVIAAGYPDLMVHFLESNPGLRSRFAREISFPDYSAEDLIKITHKMAGDARYRIDAAADAVLESAFAQARRAKSFGNARFARRLFEQSIEQQAVRLAGSPALRSDPGSVSLLTRADFEQAITGSSR